LLHKSNSIFLLVDHQDIFYQTYYPLF